jgi:hypothetical protein
MADEIIICCKRIEMGIVAPVRSTVKNCYKCQHPVWLAKSTPYKGGEKYICLQCVDWNEVTEIVEPTPEQFEDIRVANEAQRNKQRR